jgi:hypothetical protein
MNRRLWPADAAVHQITLNLLAEAADYLGRLPANPLTRDLKVKIESHLKRPGAAVHKERVDNIAKDQEWRARVGAGGAFLGMTRYTPVGLPVLECLLLRGAINFRSPAYEQAKLEGATSADSLACSIGREVVSGLKMHIREIDTGVMGRRILASWPQSPDTYL